MFVEWNHDVTQFLVGILVQTLDVWSLYVLLMCVFAGTPASLTVQRI